MRTSDNAVEQTILSISGVVVYAKEDLLILPPLSDERIVQCVIQLTNRNIGVVRIEEWKESLRDISLAPTERAMNL